MQFKINISIIHLIPPRKNIKDFAIFTSNSKQGLATKLNLITFDMLVVNVLRQFTSRNLVSFSRRFCCIRKWIT